MNNEEAIAILYHLKRCLNDKTICEGLNLAIKSLETVNQIKQVVDRHIFPECLEEDVMDIINAYYEEKEK